MRDPQKKLRKLRRLIAHPSTSAEERAAAEAAVARLESVSEAEVVAPRAEVAVSQQAPPMVELAAEVEIGNEWVEAEIVLDNAWNGD